MLVRGHGGLKCWTVFDVKCINYGRGIRYQFVIIRPEGVYLFNGQVVGIMLGRFRLAAPVTFSP